ncbi:MAG: hypothetical protein MZW92_79335 [Comamonadaceae bacterium]|nr:hypothetical protein [Comamonadaceae bacterium]
MLVLAACALPPRRTSRRTSRGRTSSRRPAGSYRLQAIQAAPDGHVLDTDGRRAALAHFVTGAVTLLSFVHTYCVRSGRMPAGLRGLRRTAQPRDGRPRAARQNSLRQPVLRSGQRHAGRHAPVRRPLRPARRCAALALPHHALGGRADAGARRASARTWRCKPTPRGLRHAPSATCSRCS